MARDKYKKNSPSGIQNNPLFKAIHGGGSSSSSGGGGGRVGKSLKKHAKPPVSAPKAPRSHLHQDTKHTRTSTLLLSSASKSSISAPRLRRNTRPLTLDEKRELERQQARDRQRREHDQKRLESQAWLEEDEHDGEGHEKIPTAKLVHRYNSNVGNGHLPPILVIRNLEPDTTVDDLKTFLRQFGKVKDCRVSVQETGGDKSTKAEAMFEDSSSTFAARRELDGTTADDNRILKTEITRLHEIVLQPEYVKVPEYVTQWDGPPLYSDNVNPGTMQRPRQQKAPRQ